MSNLITFPRKDRGPVPNPASVRLCLDVIDSMARVHGSLRVLIGSCADGPAKESLLRQQGVIEASLQEVKSRAMSL